VAGAILRLTGIRWDDGTHLHPDERYISMVEENLEFPKSVRQYFDSATSPLNPYNRGHDSFVYGTLPMVVTKALGDAIGRKGYDGAYVVGRVLSAIFDLVTIWMTYLLARRLRGRRAGLMAATLIAFCPLGIQLSHFWTVDSFLTTFEAVALVACLRIAQGRASSKGVVGAGVVLGLAVACKITALALIVPLGIAILLDAAAARGQRQVPFLRRVVVRSALVAAAALVTVRVAWPYAFLGLRLDPRYLKDIRNLVAMSKSVAGFPPALQWAGRTIFFPIDNFVRWGAGPFFGLAAIAGFIVALATAWRRERRAVLPILAQAAIVCGYHATSLAKSIRYFYPAYPALAVVAALLLAGIMARRPARRLVRAIPAIVMVGTVLAGIAFSSIYRRPNTRIAASQWIYEHVPPPARIAGESWDDGLPFPRPGHDSQQYAGPVLEPWGPDNADKVAHFVKTLAGCDWIMVTSNRIYGTVTRLPTVYPMTTAYYRALFEGRIGFERAADFTSYPSLGPLRFPDDRSEETFTVYDHPRVLLFRKTADFSEPRVRSILIAALPTVPPTIWEWEKFPSSRRKVSRAIVPARSAAAERASPPRLEGAGGSWIAAILFYLAAALLGLLALPIVTVTFGNLRDRGAGLARIVGLLVATYALSILVQTRILGNGRGAAVAGVLVLALIAAAVLARRGRDVLAFWRGHRGLLIENEIAFAVGFLLFAGLKALNPEIYWGEKPMDFSILNILVRTPTLPASDPWFAGAPLGYYTFGHEMIALLSLLTGVSTRFTFNLAFGLLGGATLAGAYSLARNWAGTRRAGFAGAAFVGILGNLAGLREWLVNQPARHEARHLDWHYFWATSRVIRDTINEYPFWSLTFSDLHAHVFAIPLFLLVATCALSLVRRNGEPHARARAIAGSAAALGAAAGAQALTNAWDVPLLAGLLVLVAVAAAFAPGKLSLKSAARAFLALAVSGLTAALFVLPLWVRGGGAPGHGRNTEPGALGIDILTHFGLFIFLAVVWWLVIAARRFSARTGLGGLSVVLAVVAGIGLTIMGFRTPTALCVVAIVLFLVAAVTFEGEPEDRLACGFLATAFFLILFTQRFFIYDRMNTFFKLYLEAWLLFAIATTVLIFRRSDRKGALTTWPLPLRGIVVVLVAASLFTTVTGARGAVGSARTNLPDGVRAARPSLDGLAYRERWHPGEYRAILWLRQSVAGTPVVLEAQGPSYMEFGRVSMLTGLPTVLGWEYHVQQRGNPAPEIEARRDAVRDIYSIPSAANVETLLRLYHVGYVYVGALERKTYPAAGLAKFGTAHDLFQVAYENPEVTIYRVAGGDTQDVVLPQRETLPEPEPDSTAAAPPVIEPETAPEILTAPAAGVAPWAKLREPRGAAVDAKGRVWIADFGHSRVKVFDEDGGALGGWGGRGSGPHGFNELCGIATRGDALYVADTWNGRIQAFDLEGNWRATASELYGPRGVATGPDGRVWAADTGNGRVMRYEKDLTGGLVIGKKGSGKTEFQGPVGIAVGPSGNVYVADTGNKRIQVLDPDGGFAASWPIVGWGEGAEPQLAVDSDETLYATDPPGNAVLEIGREGRVLRRLIAASGGQPLSRPTGLAINPKTRMLYVINSGNSSVSTVRLPERKQR
jgi:YYY domain-containing protein